MTDWIEPGSDRPEDIEAAETAQEFGVSILATIELDYVQRI